MATFAGNILTKNFQKSTHLVTLVSIPGSVLLRIGLYRVWRSLVDGHKHRILHKNQIPGIDKNFASSGPNVINKFQHRTVPIPWNKALWLVIARCVTSLNQFLRLTNFVPILGIHKLILTIRPGLHIMWIVLKNETSTLTPFVKPRDILNLAIQNVFYRQSFAESVKYLIVLSLIDQKMILNIFRWTKLWTRKSTTAEKFISFRRKLATSTSSGKSRSRRRCHKQIYHSITTLHSNKANLIG